MDATTDVFTMSNHLHNALEMLLSDVCIHGTAVVVLRDNSPLVKQFQCTVETGAS